MIPLVTCIDELREAKALIEEIKAELDEKNIAYKKDIQVGIMVETAAASLIADIFAKEADFFSIGTNDLTQYTMSVDRGNKKVSYLYSTFNPAVLRSIRHIIACGREAGIMVGMCGEAASDPMMIPLLLAFGLNEFSMSASAILRARKMVTEYSVEELQAVADKAMSFATTAEVEDYMRSLWRRLQVNDSLSYLLWNQFYSGLAALICAVRPCFSWSSYMAVYQRLYPDRKPDPPSGAVLPVFYRRTGSLLL